MHMAQKHNEDDKLNCDYMSCNRKNLWDVNMNVINLYDDCDTFQLQNRAHSTRVRLSFSCSLLVLSLSSSLFLYFSHFFPPSLFLFYFFLFLFLFPLPLALSLHYIFSFFFPFAHFVSPSTRARVCVCVLNADYELGVFPIHIRPKMCIVFNSNFLFSHSCKTDNLFQFKSIPAKAKNAIISGYMQLHYEQMRFVKAFTAVLNFWAYFSLCVIFMAFAKVNKNSHAFKSRKKKNAK